LEKLGLEVVRVEIVPDEYKHIRAKLIQVCQIEDIDLALTVGGTGMGPRDVTPEATVAVIEREVPGLPELIRREGRKSTPLAALSRARSGIRHKTLILNLPGSVKGVTESLNAIAPVLLHALEVVSGNVLRCGG
jgi:molybdenum cofactor synthesis domain-containing protein